MVRAGHPMCSTAPCGLKTDCLLPFLEEGIGC